MCRHAQGNPSPPLPGPARVLSPTTTKKPALTTSPQGVPHAAQGAGTGIPTLRRNTGHQKDLPTVTQQMQEQDCRKHSKLGLGLRTGALAKHLS